MLFLTGGARNLHASEPIRTYDFVVYCKVGLRADRSGDTPRKSSEEESKGAEMQHGGQGTETSLGSTLSKGEAFYMIDTGKR
jgi:hypothetical protein